MKNITLALFAAILLSPSAYATERFSCSDAGDSKSSEQLSLLTQVAHASSPQLESKIRETVKSLGGKYSSVSLTAFIHCSNENSLGLDFESARTVVLMKLKGEE